MVSSGVAFVQNMIINLQTESETGVGEMSWNYRVVFEPDAEGSTEGEYTIREVYYDDLGEITWWSDEAVSPSSDDFWDLAAEFDLMAEAFERPVLVLIDDELVEDDAEDDAEDEAEDEASDEDEESED
jgi:hypothetical protein